MKLNMTKSQITRRKYNRNARYYNFVEWPVEWLWYRRWRQQLFKNVKGTKILEVGIGTGKNIKYYPKDAWVVGVDLSESMMKRAKFLAEADRICLAQMSAEHLAFSDDTFDAVVATFVFCSVNNPVAGFQEIGRVLKPQGQALLLEHVLPQNKLLAWIFNKLNILTVKKMGVHINRKTDENIQKASLKLMNAKNLLSTIFKLFVVTGEGNN